MAPSSTLLDAKADVVRTRVIDAAAAVLAAERPLTFKEIAERSGVPERTVYRHFPSRAALLSALFAWTNAQIGHEGPRPTDRAGLAALVRAAFGGFDQMAPVVRQMLIEPDGRAARLADVEQRRAAAIRLVRNEAPGLDNATTRRTAAAIQTMTAAATWQTLHEYWDFDGPGAAEVSVLAIELMLEGARARVAATASAEGAS